MEKGRGYAIGAVLAAAVLLRPAGSNVPQTASAGTTQNDLPAVAAAIEQREGPWAASCRYWAPVRERNGDSAAGLPEVVGTFDNKPIALHVPLHDYLERKPGSGCALDRIGRWGVPDEASVNVTAIIATVPDPAHTHLALLFDRMVDALLQAAADSQYVASYYWLPWRNRTALRAGETPSQFEPAHDSEREREPGLIVLRHVKAAGPDEHSFYRTIYLFLVAETPSQGIDGFQLRNAFLYEDQLAAVVKGVKGTFSTGADGRVAIVGPIFSGSAASLRAGVESAARAHFPDARFEIAGATSTEFSVKQLANNGKNGAPVIDYHSFGDDSDFDMKTLAEALSGTGYDLRRFALLVEEGTPFGSGLIRQVEQAETRGEGLYGPGLVIRFPRDISLLRNAQDGDAHSGGPSAFPSPYLRFSLKDYGAQDGMPLMSGENSPLSQEAQLMTIGRELRHLRAQLIAITATNTLDEIFLAQFLRRACPEARLVFLVGDVLAVREIDDAPFIGSIVIAPFPLIGLGRSETVGGVSHPLRANPSSWSIDYYDALSYTLWRSRFDALRLQGYTRVGNDRYQAQLWAATIGSDGYYPLAMLKPCAGDSLAILPAFQGGEIVQQDCTAHAIGLDPSPVYPSILWEALCGVVLLLCWFHIGMLWAADYWSPSTRDLAIGDNDQPRRRSLYAHVAAGALLSMAFALSFPAISLARATTVGTLGLWVGSILLGSGVATALATAWKTRGHWGWNGGNLDSKRQRVPGFCLRAPENAYLWLNLLLFAATLGASVVWIYLCRQGSFDGAKSFAEMSFALQTNNAANGAWPVASIFPLLIAWFGQSLFGQAASGSANFAGLSFSLRCINPASGVSPVAPALLLFFAWYCWAILQSHRLRFSDNGRPRLPEGLKGGPSPYVADEDLAEDDSPRKPCLYRNITCLMITRQLLQRRLKFRRSERTRAISKGRIDPALILADIALAGVICGAFLRLVVFTPMRSVDRFLSPLGKLLASPYDILIASLLFSLIVFSLAGCVRMILIWSSLRTGLLDRLEAMPIRFAFSRIKGANWMTMLRQDGLHEHWRDISRSLESMRQMLHEADWWRYRDSACLLTSSYKGIQEWVGHIRDRYFATSQGPHPADLDYRAMAKLEIQLAGFAEILLSGILVPYWKSERTGPVEGKAMGEADHHEAAAPAIILAAEEYVAIRYISMIRAVLANLRCVIAFVSISFALAVVAWNSYPFQPRQKLDWFFTALLLLLGVSVVWVFAQMHRNPILSRVTDTKENELGFDFYLRVATFGALPVLTWLASQFPDIAATVYRFIAPVEPALK